MQNTTPEKIQLEIPKAGQVLTSEQPKARSSMSLSGNSRNALNFPLLPNGNRKWSNGLMSCFQDMGTCCMATWCACVVFQRNKDRYEFLQATNQPQPKGVDPFGEDFALYAFVDVCCGAGWILQIANRTAVRKRYGIEESDGGDCMASFCCGPCSLTQVSREIQLEENLLLGLSLGHKNATKNQVQGGQAGQGQGNVV